MIQAIYDGLFSAVDRVSSMRRTWDGLAGRIDNPRHAAVAETLRMQYEDAILWRDVMANHCAKLSGIADQRPR